jgi:hypothetical protein
MTKSYRFEGVATAVSSIAHGGETLGSTTFLRRESFLQPDGRIEAVPVISGNAWRGVFRDIGAELVWEALGCRKLPLPVVATLWCGGTLVKTSRDEQLSGARLARLRTLVPQVSMFGGAGGGRIIEGTLAVGKLVPICQETAHTIPARYLGPSVPLPSMADLVQEEQYSRLDDTARPQVAGLGEAAATQGPTDAEDLGPDDGDDGEAAGLLMRYGVETLIVGTRLYTWLSLQQATAAQRQFLTDILARWAGADATAGHVGGRSRIGHGRVSVDLHEQIVGGNGRDDGDPDWRGALHRHRDQVLAALADLT